MQINFKGSAMTPSGISIGTIYKTKSSVRLQSPIQTTSEIIRSAQPLDTFVKVDPKTEKPIPGTQFMVLNNLGNMLEIFQSTPSDDKSDLYGKFLRPENDKSANYRLLRTLTVEVMPD